MVTSRDVARLAGVSQSTVSYVMSGRRSISAETRRRVESAIEQLAFQPNAGARALKSQRTRVIGLMVPFGTGADTSGLLPFIETIANCAPRAGPRHPAGDPRRGLDRAGSPQAPGRPRPSRTTSRGPAARTPGPAPAGWA